MSTNDAAAYFSYTSGSVTLDGNTMMTRRTFTIAIRRCRCPGELPRNARMVTVPPSDSPPP